MEAARLELKKAKRPWYPVQHLTVVSSPEADLPLKVKERHSVSPFSSIFPIVYTTTEHVQLLRFPQETQFWVCSGLALKTVIQQSVYGEVTAENQRATGSRAGLGSC
jgi:hypothetical protein